MSDKVGPFEVKYEAGHSYNETWLACDDRFCPNCGDASVWVEDSDGDYYMGPTFLCMNCHATGHCWYGDVCSTSWQDRQRYDAIKQASGGASSTTEAQETDK